MRDLLPTLTAWRAARHPFVLALVVGTTGGSPRELGAAMAIRMAEGAPAEVVGSISGGCVEAAVYDLAPDILATNRARLEHYGTADAEAVGLTCGGTLSVLVIPATLGTGWLTFADSPSGAVATVIAGPDHLLGHSIAVDGALEPEADHGRHTMLEGCPDALSHAIARDATALIATGHPATLTYAPDGCPLPNAVPGAPADGPPPHDQSGDRPPSHAPLSPELAAPSPPVTVFFSVFTPPPRLIILGALDHAAALATIGRFLGFHVTVCDARAVFATPARFPDAHEVVVDWPHRHLAAVPIDHRTAICVLTHDPKFDVPALTLALRSPAGYIGAMGSRRTCDDRAARLRAAGISDAELARLRAPIGLDLGATTPAETAVSIAAELIAVRSGRAGEPLSRTSGPLHGTVSSEL